MAPLSEIEKLQRRYDENPQALAFAPLAEAYRKTGDVPRALEVLTAGLQIHPDYIPASIVLGRCRLDQQDDPGAERAFSHVLALDPENVIALKALADIAERGERMDQAEHWLTLLLAVDRSNDEAREQLERVTARRAAGAGSSLNEAAAAEVPASDAPTPDVVIADAPPDSSPAEIASFEVPIDSPETESPAAGQSEPASPEPWTDIHPPEFDWQSAVAEWAGRGQARADTSRPDGDSAAPAEPSTRDEAEPDAEPVAGEFSDQPLAIDAPEDVTADADASGAAAGEFDIGVEQSEEIVLRVSDTNEFQVPSASEFFGAVSTEASLEPEPEQSLDSEEEVEPDVTIDVQSEFAAMLETDAATADETADIDMVEVTDGAAGESEESASFEPEQDALVVEPASAGSPDPSPWTGEPLDSDTRPHGAEEESQLGDEAEQDDEFALDRTDDAEPWPEPEGRPEPAEAAAEPDEDEFTVPAEDEESPTLIVTESMAELYLLQGHRGQALDVLRQLLSRRPDDDRLQERVTSLEAELAAETAAARGPDYAASASGGEAVGSLLQRVLQARPPQLPDSVWPHPVEAESASPAEAGSGAARESASDVPGHPTRPASDALSLGSVFGDEAASAPPAMTPGAGGAPVSFDAFFAGGDAPAPPDATRTSRPAPRPADDDLDQFTAWLQNLKR